MENTDDRFRENRDTVDIWRPRIHFTPPNGWMNDPCGLVWIDGVFHLYYQHNPDDVAWGPMHWGHATTTDLVHWTDHPIALSPDATCGMVFTGSAVALGHDEGNGPSGTRRNYVSARVAAVYTGAVPRSSLKDTLQQQCLATSPDGFRWTKHGVVLPNPGLDDFRDPKVVWHDATARWVMVLAAGREVLFYSSVDLRSWRFESRFGRGLGFRDGVWECPDLFPMPVHSDDGDEPTGAPQNRRWVLIVHAGEGLPHRHAGAQFIVGDFDGTTFQPDMENLQPVDYGHEFYAAQTWSASPASYGDRLWIAWPAHWDTVDATPRCRWRGVQTIPRIVEVVQEADGTGYRLRQRVPPAISSLRRATAAASPHRRYDVDGASAYEIVVSAFESAVVTLSFGTAGTITISHTGDTFTVDRRRCWMGAFGAAIDPVKSVPIRCRRSETRALTILFDRSILECFVDDGSVVTTDLVFPTEPLRSIEIEPHGEVFALRATIATDRGR